MAHSLTNKDLLQFLKSLQFSSGLFDRLKVYYRPIICPFVDLIELAKQGEKIGDIGCGSGQFCLLLDHFAKPSYIYGIEITERLVDNAHQLFSKYSKTPYKFEQYNGVEFPAAVSEMDVLFLNDVLHHVPPANQEQFVKDLMDKMKPGARLVVKDIDGASPLVYFNKLHDTIFAGERGNERSVSEVTTWLEQSGAQIIQSTKKRMYVYPHYTIVASKQ
jgi:2-polyprenyl-3-methyl-5-hydroxy-6-metoxy-1,4-benzoquinol methylase